MDNSNQLPDLKKQFDEELAEDFKFFRQLERFMAMLNADVDDSKLEKHPHVKARYLPISYKEMNLDTIFYGLWETYDYKYQIVQNEMIGDIVLAVFHPLQKMWVRRTGSAAIQIMSDALSKEQKEAMTKDQIRKYYLDPLNKKSTALSMGGFAKLKSDCFRNACLSLGKFFGRDVNRDHVGAYNPKGKQTDAKITKLREELSGQISICQDDELRLSVIDTVIAAEEDGKNTVAFYKEQLDKFKNG